MAVQKPLVLNAGVVQQLQAGDTIEGVAIDSACIGSSWYFNPSTANANPGVNNFSMDNASPAFVDVLWLNDTTIQGVDIGTLLGFLKPTLGETAQIFIQQKNNPAKAVLFALAGIIDPVDNTGWWRIRVGAVGSLGVFDAGEECTFVFIPALRDIAITQLLGDVTTPAVSGVSSATATIANNVVSNAKLRDSTGFSVIGRSVITSGDPADIVAPINTVLGRTSGNLGFTQAATAQYADDSVTFPKFQNITTDRLVGRDTAGTGDVEEISLGVSLEFSGSQVLQRAALTGDITAAADSNATTIANDAVSNAKLANMPANTIKGNNTAGVADPLDLTTAQVTAMLDVFTSLLKGLVPASGGGTTNFLRADGVFAAPPGISGAWPVGAVFISVDSTNPGTSLGFGTWAAFGTGRVLVGLDSGDPDFDTVEETGGSKSVTLITSQIPSHTHVQDSHNHTQNAHTHVQNSHTHGFTDLRGLTTGASSTTRAVTESVDNSSTATGLLTAATTATNQNETAVNQATTATNQNTGGDGSHTNVQPYIVVFMWKRTA